MIKNKYLKYRLNNQEYRVTFCSDKEAPDISNDLSRLSSDKKMLVIIDKKINKEIIKTLLKDLKQSNFDITILEVGLQRMQDQSCQSCDHLRCMPPKIT